jgi:putative chitinase
MRLTIGELQELAPRAHLDQLEALVNGLPEIEAAGINTQLRLVHFLAQTAHESGGFTITREATNWTAEQMCALWPTRFKTRLDPRILKCRGDAEALANLAYSGRKDLGNVEDDDGWAYRGGGFLQITGRACYHEAGVALGIDLEGMPELIEDPVISLNAALWVWGRHPNNEFADWNYGRAIGNAINRGNPYSRHDPIGFKSREQWFARAWNILGDGKLPVTDHIASGAHGPKVEQLQRRLRELGYGVGAVDNVFGPTLARAVVAFKHDSRLALEPRELVGPLTLAALENAKPIELSPERVEATQNSLALNGSTEIDAGVKAKSAGKLLLGLGGVEGARQAGVLDGTVSTLSSVSAFRSTLAPCIDAVQWGLKHWFWVAVLVGGVWFWTKGHQVIAARLRAHRFGFNLFR